MKTETTITLTIGGVSRTVALDYHTEDGERIKTFVSGVVATIGRGTARYPDSISLWPVSTDHPAHRGNRTAVAADSTEWQYHYGTCVRNRQAQIVGWAEDMPVTNDADQTRH